MRPHRRTRQRNRRVKNELSGREHGKKKGETKWERFQAAEFLKARLLDAVLEHDAVPGEMDEYGNRYLVDFECVKGGRRALLRSGWIIRWRENSPG